MPNILLAQTQTNDPLVDEQQYLFDVHRVGQAWSYTTGASNVKIGVYSYTGFIQNHEDLSTSRLAAPIGSLQDPEVDIASEMAGIVGASTNNGVGMAGIDRAATLQSYSVLTQDGTCIDDSRCSDEEQEVSFERPDGTQETYYLNLYRFSDQIKKGRNNGVDVHLVPLGLPSGDPANYSLDAPGDPNPFLNLRDRGPRENPNPPPYTTLGNALYTVGQRFKNSLCGGWFGDCLTPPDPATLFRDEIGFAVAKDGGVVVTPAGNLNEDGDLPPRHLPGMFDPYAVTVGGIEFNSNRERVPWDRTRPAAYVDVAAFAKNVVGTSGAGSKQYDTNFTSTAASASIGAGVSSLLKAEMPSLTGEDVEEILKRTARDAGAPGEDEATGTGAIDAGAALAYVRNNDVQRSTQSVDYVISDEVIGKETELRGNGFWQYSSTNCQRPRGDLHEFRAWVSYSQTFREAPDVWTRWGGSDGVLSSFGEGGVYYDPFQKRIEVVDTDGRGFTVKGYYWKADFENRIGKECQVNVPIPKRPENFKIAYTAVGSEGPPPVRVSLSGPDYQQHGESATWTATAEGGVGAASYDWDVRPVGSSSWVDYSCSGSTCTTYFQNDTDITQDASVRVQVTKGAETDQAVQDVTVSPPFGGGCDDQFICNGAQHIGIADVAVQAQHRTARVSWSTTGSSLPVQFTVEHRADSTGSWTELGTLGIADSLEADSADGASYQYDTNELELGLHQFRVRLGASGSKATLTSEVVSASVELGSAYELSVYPNPVRRQATVSLALQEAQSVSLAVYDVLGRRVATLHDGRLPGQDRRRFRIRAADVGLASGTYFVRLVGDGFTEVRSLTVTR